MLSFPVRLGLVGVTVPLAGLATWLYLLNRIVSKHSTSSHGRRSPKTIDSASSDQPTNTKFYPVSLPADVTAKDSEWILAHERVVSGPVAIADLAYPFPDTADKLLLAYARAVHVAFSWTPSAFAIRSMLKDPSVRRTFTSQWIRSLEFKVGDRVNGAYTVSYHGNGSTPGSERVELVLDLPPTYTGPRPRVLILAEVARLPDTDGEKEDGRRVVFVNESWMWRRSDEKPTLVESTVGGWLHSLMAKWLVFKGVEEVRGET